MSGGGAARDGWAWWPPSRRRQQQQTQTRAAQDRGRSWALLAAVLLLLLWLLPAGSALGLSAAALAWAAWAGGTGRALQQQQQPPRRPFLPTPSNSSGSSARPAGAGAVANGGLVAMAALREKSGGRPRVLLGGSPLASPAAHFVLPPRRRYPIHQAQYASLGTLPSICWDGYRRKNRLSTYHPCPVQSPVTVKIARPDSNMGRSPLLEQLFSPSAFSPAPNNTPDPCAKEVVLSALKESRKRAMMEEEGEEETYHEGLPGGQESKRRRHGSGGSVQSMLEPLMANGGPVSLVSKAGSLKRSFLSHCLDDSSSKRSRTSSLSSANSLCAGGISSSIRNAIASSYSSSRGLSQLWKRSGQSTSPLSSPASSRSQTPERPAKKTRSLDASLMEEEAQQASSTSTPARTDKAVQAEKAAETPVTRHSFLGPPSSPGSRRKRKRRIQLLPTSRVDSCFTLPPPPELGYSPTSEDLDADKKATLQRFNKVLEEKMDSTPDSPEETTSGPNVLTFSLPAAKSLPVTLAGTVATGSNPLLESLKKMQGEQSSPAQAAVATETLRPRTPAAALDLSSSVPATTLEAKPLTLGVPVSLAVAPSSTAADEPTSCVATMSSSELGESPVRPPSAPRPSVLGLLINPPVSKPVTAASEGPSTAPVLKPLFGSLAKSGSTTFSSSSASEAPASSPASSGTVPTLGPPCGGPGNTFKPIFGEPPTLANSALPSAAPTMMTTPSLFTFKQSPQKAPAHKTPSSHPISGASAFPGLLETGTALASSSAPASTAPVSTSKPVFSFGPGMPAAPSSSTPAAAVTTATTTSTTPPFLFGSLPSSTVPGAATAAPVFQFGKAAAAATKPALNPGAGPAFNQVPPSSTTGPAPAATTTAAATPFSIFGSGAQGPLAPPSTTQQPAPLTFGTCPPAFSTAFGAPSKPPPPYRASANQLTLDAGAPEGQQAASKPGPGPLSFGAQFSFAGSGTQPATQPAFGTTTTQAATFGGNAPLAPFGTKSSTSQPLAFGATTSVFSFGTATTSAAAAPSFGATTQTTSSSTGGFVFGGSVPSSFTTFGAPGQPAAAAGSAFGIGVATGGSGTGGSAGGFSFGSGQSGAAGAAPTFGSSLPQQPPLGSQNQGNPFAFSVPGATPESKPAFGGAPTPTFGQGLPTPGGGTAGSALSFGVPIAPAFAGAGPGATFGPTTPTFSIGAGSKIASRQRLQARRHTSRKK